MTARISSLLLAAVAAPLLAGCGNDAPSTGTAAPDATPAALPAGIYVSAEGSDTAQGDAFTPVASITEGIRRAEARGLTEVFVIGPAEYREVVVLSPAVALRGELCTPAPGESLRFDPSCRARLRGASPLLIASGLDRPTLVSGLDVEALAAFPGEQEIRFEVPGQGCIGRAASSGITDLPACTPAPDDAGRVPADSSIAVSLADSHSVTFLSTRLAANEAGAGIDGADGEPGENGAGGQDGQGILGGSTIAEGCQDGLGGRGGNAGAFDPLVLTNTPASTAQAGGAAGALAGGSAAPFSWERSSGMDGGHGLSGAPGAPGADAPVPQNVTFDAWMLAAPSGSRGSDGTAGQGGSGGGGGAAANRRLYACGFGGCDLTAVAGFAPVVIAQQVGFDLVRLRGETDGGAGGAGGNGGCGGRGGEGGQSGGASVAVLARNATVDVRSSSVEPGRGGAGGAGGRGGSAGMGSFGGFGAAPEETAPSSMQGYFDENGKWVITLAGGNAAGGSRGGRGGNGGAGGEGGAGGDGAPGAGGASVGVLLFDGATVELSGSEITTPAPGEGGGVEGRRAPSGVAATVLESAD